VRLVRCYCPWLAAITTRRADAWCGAPVSYLTGSRLGIIKKTFTCRALHPAIPDGLCGIADCVLRYGHAGEHATDELIARVLEAG